MTELVYVDEQQAQVDQVLQSAVVSGQFTQYEVQGIRPAASIDETIDEILSYHCKVLITDYRLSEYKPDVEFNGADLVREFWRRFDMFPCFVTTSFADEAADEALDTNIIFPKSDFLGRNSANGSLELPFFVRVRKKISEYNTFVEETKGEWKELAERSEKEPLSAEETERLIELDDLVEGMSGKHLAVESHIKREALKPIRNIIDTAEDLIKKIKKEIS